MGSMTKLQGVYRARSVRINRDFEPLRSTIRERASSARFPLAETWEGQSCFKLQTGGPSWRSTKKFRLHFVTSTPSYGCFLELAISSMIGRQQQGYFPFRALSTTSPDSPLKPSTTHHLLGSTVSHCTQHKEIALDACDSLHDKRQGTNTG